MNDGRRLLEEKIRTRIPISTHMGFRIRALSADAISVSGGWAENVNIHGTAFAGSLYAICALAAWGLVACRLPPDASLVKAHGEIRYLAPVVGPIHAKCIACAGEMDRFLVHLADRRRARISLSVTVGGQAKPAAVFEATLHARLPGSPEKGSNA